MLVFEPRGATLKNFMGYVLLLEGEPRLPSKVLENIWKDTDKLIQAGEKKKPGNLIQLLKISSNFYGVGRFDSSRVRSLYLTDPPNCWSLPVVTLTAISLALANISDELLASVREGLNIVKLIEETLDRSGGLETIRRAADVAWVGVEVYGKWDDVDLRSMRGKPQKEILQDLSDAAEKTVRKLFAESNDFLECDTLNWPPDVIAANSMYRIAKTIMLRIEDGELQIGGTLFDSISITISDILAACLTNLKQVIRLKCHREDIREREESVSRAAILLGESKEILEILQQRELPSLDVEKAAKIDEWKAFMAWRR